MLLFYEANPANLLCPTEFRDTTKNSCRISTHGLTYQGSMEITFLIRNGTDACIPPCYETRKGNLSLQLRPLRCSCSAPPLHFEPGNSEGTTAYRKDIKPGLSSVEFVSTACIPLSFKNSPRVENKCFITPKQISTTVET